MPDVPEKEPLRAAVDAAIAHEGKVAFAGRARLSRDTLYRYLDGEEVGEGTRRKLSAAVHDSRPTASGVSVPSGTRRAELAGTITPDPVPDPDEDAVGYWRGYLDASRDILEAAHELSAQANAMVARATARIGRMVAAGPRWESATVRAREARATAAVTPRGEAPEDAALAAEVEAQLGRLTADEARAIVARFQERTGE